MLRKWMPLEKCGKYQNFLTHLGLSLSLECSGEISRKSVKSAYPINSLSGCNLPKIKCEILARKGS